MLENADVTGYGVFAGISANLSDSIENLYKNSGEDINSTTWIENNSLWHATLRGVEDELTVYRCDETGTNDSENGDFLKWNLKFNVKDTAYLKEVAAVAYVIIDGEYVFLKQRTESVVTLASKYVSSGTITDSKQLAAMSYFADMN